MSKAFRKNILNSQSGFTLIEILVAITLLSFLMVGVYSIVENGTNTKDRVISEDRELLQVQTALNRFAIDFSQIYSPLYFSDEQRDKTYYSGKGIPPHVVNTLPEKKKYDASERYPLLSSTGDLVPALENSSKSTFGFMTSANRRKVENSRQSRYAWVRYSLENNDLEGEEAKADYQLVRTFIPDSIYSKTFDWDKARAQVLLRNVKSIDFNFWNKETKKYVSSIKELNRDKNIIRAVLVNLVWIDQNEVEHEVSRAYRSMWPEFDAVQDEIDKYLQGGTTTTKN